MERAIDELKYTISLASEYFASGNHHLKELQCHAAALKEDTEIAEKARVSDKNADKDADDVIREARRLKRDLEKLSFPLLRAKEAARLQLQKDEIELQKKISQRRDTSETSRVSEKKVSTVKLPSIKIPVFSGEVEQFRGFKQIFIDLTEDADMSSTKKWLLLKEHLSGKALEIVQELQASPETYKVASTKLWLTFIIVCNNYPLQPWAPKIFV